MRTSPGRLQPCPGDTATCSFLGSSGKPQPISEAEAARILNTKDEAAAAAPKIKVSVDYEIGDQVKVLEGPFASFNGVVEELDFGGG